MSLSQDKIQTYIVRLKPLFRDLGIDASSAAIEQWIPLAKKIVEMSRCNAAGLKRKVITLRQDVRRAVRDGDADWADGFRGEHFEWDWNQWRRNIDKLRTELDQIQHDHRKAMWIVQRTLAAKRKMEIVMHELRDAKAQAELTDLATEMNKDADDEGGWLQEQ
ncbi:hypothetical protein TI39_contig428g00019 [Zymoseptoria brevis]|uniref:Uncharacterized protein n=1 Tax=Zymoseptoria brevis TaxID=1047168 RepID=A0A0F4GLC2_9PEZI|nr:hypothetical protein TI39_contig428g00019 [Zymoseptoria brevis]